MNTVFLSIGSNINKDYNILKCLDLLADSYGNMTKSSIYETFKVNNDKTVEIHNHGKNFWNLMIKINTFDTYSTILKKTKDIENDLGRKRNKHDKGMDRTIDIDIILFNQEIIVHHGVTKVPHRELGHCFYVDIPLLELDPSIIHPLTKKSIKEIVDKTYLEKCQNFIKKVER